MTVRRVVFTRCRGSFPPARDSQVRIEGLSVLPVLTDFCIQLVYTFFKGQRVFIIKLTVILTPSQRSLSVWGFCFTGFHPKKRKERKKEYRQWHSNYFSVALDVPFVVYKY